MLVLRAHLVYFLLKSFDLDFSGADFSPQFFNLVVQHKFEFLQFLDFFAQVLNPGKLLLQCFFTVHNLADIAFLIQPQLVLGHDILTKKLILFLHVSLLLGLSIFFIPELFLFQKKIFLERHTLRYLI